MTLLLRLVILTNHLKPWYIPLAVISSTLVSTGIANFFIFLDEDKDASISLNEIMSKIKQISNKTLKSDHIKTIQELFAKSDINRDKLLSLDEFSELIKTYMKSINGADPT